VKNLSRLCLKKWYQSKIFPEIEENTGKKGAGGKTPASLHQRPKESISRSSAPERKQNFSSDVQRILLMVSLTERRLRA